MNTPQIQITHYEHRKCKFSESVDLKINGKTLVTPTFAPRLKSDSDLKVYDAVRHAYSPRQLSAYVVRLLDAGRTLYPSMKKKAFPLVVDQSTLDTRFTPQQGEQVLLIDPALEYMYYTVNMERLATTPFVSHTIRDYITKFLEKSKKLEIERQNEESKNVIGRSEFRDTTHTNFWTCVYKDASMRMKLIRDTFNLELKAKTDVLIPPVPLITSPHLLEVAIFMNEKSRAFSPALSQDKRECADYFIIKPQILKNQRMMSTIKEYVTDSETPLTLFKFKSLNLCDENMALERDAFKSFLMELSLVSHVENKTFGLLEAGNQTFPAAFSSFAIVSTGFNLDREERRKDQKEISPYANRYDPARMIMQSKETYLTTVENNGHVIPCDCRDCIENPTVPENDFIEYNRRAKTHYLLCREQEMKEIIDAIAEGKSQMGFEKLQRSSLKNLIDVMPR
jgi:hypothetical protein